MKSIRLVAVLGIAASALSAHGALLVVPNHLATNDVDYGSGSLWQVIHNQQVYHSSQFPAQPIRITELRFRPDRTYGMAFSTTISNLQVHLSTTTNAPHQLSATYAQNVGPNYTTVFSGSLAISSLFTGPANGPKAFDIVIPLQTPFDYNPAQGNLCMDIRNFSGSGASSISGTGGPTGSRAFGYNVASSTAEYVADGVDALQIVYESLSPPLASSVPRITSFTPALGSNGTSVTLVGTNFSSVAVSNIVYFGAVRAVVTAASPTSMTVIVPSGSTYASPSVTVAGLYGQARSPFLPTFNGGGATIDATSFAPKFDLLAGSGQVAVVTGDMDGDGKPDVVAVNYDANTVSVIRNISASGSLSSGSFAPRVDFTVGSTPNSCAVGDVDGDGKLDIIVGNNGAGGGNTVSVLRNTSTAGTINSGSFAPAVNFTIATGPTRIAVGDLDGDGRLDLAVITAAGSAGVSVLRNTGVVGSINSGTFAPFVHFITGPNSWDVKIADLDGDGKPDMLASSYDNGTLSLLRNVSTPGSLALGSFAPKVDFFVGTTFSTAIGDLDGDGKLDLVASRYLAASVVVLRNTSSAGSLNSTSFAAPVSFATPVGARDVAIGDLNGDGKPDVAVSCYDTSRISVLRNTSALGSISASSFAPRVDFVSGAGPAMAGIGDLDGDGRPDLVTSSFFSSSVAVLRNTVAPTPPFVLQPVPQITSFSPTLGSNGTVVTLIGTNFSSVALSNIVYFGAVRASVTVASLTSMTVIVPPGATYAPPSVTVAGLTGTALRPFVPTFANASPVFDTNAFAPKFDLPAGSTQVAVQIGDLDGDGKPDVVTANVTANTVSVFRNISINGTLTAASFAPRVDIATGTQPYSCSLGDVDGDGRLDIIVGNNANGTGNTVSVIRNLSTPGSLAAASFAARVNFTVATGPTRIAVGDLDGDGHNDLAVITAQGGGVSVLRNIGTAGTVDANTFAPFVHFLTGPNSWDVKIGDLDGDGKRDLVAASYNNGTISLLRNLSAPGSLTTSSFAPKVDIVIGATFNSEIGDLDDDGKPDIVVTKYNSSSVAVLRNITSLGSLTTGSFAAPVSFTTGPEPRDITIGDINGDGKPDLVVCAIASSRISILRNQVVTGIINASSFAPRVDFVTGAAPALAAIGDLDADGRPDIVASSFHTASVSVLKNILPFALPPIITAVTPASLVVNEGADATFTATVQGTAPLYFQWLFAGSPLAGATNAVLNLTNVVFAQAGNYSVLVSNIAGTATSSNVVLDVNRAPIADASATVALVVAPLNCDGGISQATVVLDGSNSSDPDADALSYAWFQDGVSNVIATGVVAVVQLSAGSNHLTLVVSDGMASSSQSFVVEVITTDTAVERLMVVVQANADRPQPLIASLRAALASIDRCQPEAAINQLEAFKNKVLAQVAPNDPDLANLLLGEAQALIDILNGGTAAPTTALEITAISQGDNGKPHLKIRGASGRVHIVETSVDMVNWTKIGVAGCCGGCDYEFNDAQTPDAGARFYRVVSPR